MMFSPYCYSLSYIVHVVLPIQGIIKRMRTIKKRNEKSSPSQKSSTGNKLQRYWWCIPVAVLVGCSAVAVLLLKTGSQTVQSQNFNPKTAALVDCLGTPRESDLSCWQERMEVLVTQNDTNAKAFADANAAYQTSTYVKSNCHQIAHIIGRAAGKKYGDVTKAYTDGNDFCSSGYYHGVLEAALTTTDKSAILSKLNDICTGVKNEGMYKLKHFNCVHGLGHGLMQLHDNELFTALNSCDTLTDNWERQSCLGGVFMENIMNEFNPGHETKYLKSDDLLYPCDAVDDYYKEPCYLIQTAHMLKSTGQNFAKTFELCGSVAAPYDATCYQSLGRDASGNTVSNLDSTVNSCNLGATERARENCYIGAVKDFVWHYNNLDQGLVLCDRITNEPTVRDTCISTARSYYATF